MRTLTTAVASLYALLPLAAFAQHSGHDHKPPAAGARAAGVLPTTASQQGPGRQVTCPVMGGKVDPAVSTTYEGRKVFFCCPGCVGKFEKSPEQYLPAVYRQIYPQSIQVTCPVMGGDVDPDVFVEHKGQKVYFCCPGCDGKFKKDPAKYESRLKDSFTRQVHCPIDGKAVDAAIGLPGKQGTTYFCSEQCRKKFQADSKYAPSALPAVGVLAAGPTTQEDLASCIVTGRIGKRGLMQPVVYRDKVYFAHSSDCVNQFRADPELYITRAAEASKPGASQGGSGRPAASPVGTDSPDHAAHGPAVEDSHRSHRAAGHGGNNTRTHGGCSPGCSH